jgi:hypothetical protein
MKYNKNNEGINKYTAGLWDGDGIIYLRDNGRGKLRLTMEICGDSRVKKVEDTLLELFDHYSFGRIDRKATGMMSWVIEGNQAVSLFNTIKKHSVVKAIHGERIVNLWYQARNGREVLLPQLKRWLSWSRRNTSSLKPKKHFNWAWLAGYIDSDGYIGYKQEIYTGIRFGANKDKDHSAIELIAASTGRPIRYNKTDNTLRLDLHMSKKHRGTAQKYLVKLLPHLRIKKWQSEQLLRYVKTPNKSYCKPPAETK